MATLEDILAIDPSARAVQFEGQWWTYADLAERISSVRAVLRDLGVVAGAPVATILPNRPEGLVALLAVLLERACLVTISPRQVELDLGRAPDSVAVLGPTASMTKGVAVAGTGLVVAGWIPTALCRDGVAVLMATSGTTGDPKRIPITYATIDGVVSGVRAMAGTGDARAALRDDATLICFPYTNLSGLLPQLIALVSGRRTALLERFAPAEVASLVAEHRMSSLALNPTAMRMLLDAEVDPAELSSVRYVRSGSAPLSPELAERFEVRFGVGVLQSYGQTEVGGEVVGWSAADHRSFGVAKRGSVGRPHAGVELRIARRRENPDEELPVGEVGELWLRGARNVTGWHRTGDLARVDVDGFLWLEGRADGLIICGGFNIVPAALERVLEQHPAVAEAAVVPKEDDRLGEVPVALVVPSDGAEIVVEELLAHCRRLLEPFQLPRAVVVVDELPKNEIGKLHLPTARQLAAASRPS